jgi:hypothetical protein
VWFIRPQYRKGSCCYELYKGKWNKRTYWKDDSICINDDMYDSEFDKIIIKFVPTYGPFGETKITKEQREQIKTEAKSVGGKSAEIVNEAEMWMLDNFSKYHIFTILGI